MSRAIPGDPIKDHEAIVAERKEWAKHNGKEWKEFKETAYYHPDDGVACPDDPNIAEKLLHAKLEQLEKTFAEYRREQYDRMERVLQKCEDHLSKNEKKSVVHPSDPPIPSPRDDNQ